MQKIVNSALWGKKDSGARPRIIAAVVVAAVALVAPATVRAADVPASLLSQAQANPTQSFDVIVQTGDSSQNPVQATVNAVTTGSQQSFRDAVKAANDAAKKAADLTKKAADAAKRATDAAAKAAQTGSAADQAAALKAQADAKAAQDAAKAAQGAAVLAQVGILNQQAGLAGDLARAQSEISMQYSVIPAVAASLTGADIVGLQASSDTLAVTPNTAVTLSGNDNPQKWVDAAQVKPFWGSPQRKAASGRTPTIAIVDSGIDSFRTQDFGNRVLGQVNLVSSGPNSPGDGRGHGTMVASIAAGSADKRSGADPDAPLLSLDVIDDNGQGRASDVIAAADWILANKDRYNIRVANFSLETAIESSFLYDPVSKAVEQLWFNGVVVVAASGNEAVNGAMSGVHYAPASDPFVITVGAVDVGKDGNVDNDKAAPWSSWGYTNDGFMKPEVSAPGRYMIGACTATDTLCAAGGQDPKLLAQGYDQLSGTSFAAPIVSGIAAAVLALHPDWTPDQVKGQIMLTANRLRSAVPGSAGVGEVDMKDATGDVHVLPPNPNLALDSFIAQTPSGAVFDAASWSSTAQANASWNAASWNNASWNAASWNAASWNAASWNNASWNAASWNAASWNAASWNASAGGLALPNNAAYDPYGEG